MSFVFIRKRSKNYIVYLEYKDENSGKKIQKNMGSFEKKRDASRKLNELKDSIFNDELVLPNAVNLENFLIDFLDKHIPNKLFDIYIFFSYDVLENGIIYFLKRKIGWLRRNKWKI